MKTIKLTSRDGAIHKLVPTRKEGFYVFKSAKKWMPLSLHGTFPDFKAFDPDGGPMISLGDVIENKEVKSIKWVNDKGLVVEIW